MKRKALLLLFACILSACSLPARPLPQSKTITLNPKSCFQPRGKPIIICNASQKGDDLGLVTIDVYLKKYKGWVKNAYLIPMFLDGTPYTVDGGSAKGITFEMDWNYILEIMPEVGKQF